VKFLDLVCGVICNNVLTSFNRCIENQTRQSGAASATLGLPVLPTGMQYKDTDFRGHATGASSVHATSPDKPAPASIMDGNKCRIHIHAQHNAFAAITNPSDVQSTQLVDNVIQPFLPECSTKWVC
jgi:hypothetical protein